MSSLFSCQASVPRPGSYALPPTSLLSFSKTENWQFSLAPCRKLETGNLPYMITVTRLNNTHVVINAELIKFVESTPDTMITLTTGDRIMVKEPADEVIRKVVEYGRMLRRLVEPS